MQELTKAFASKNSVQNFVQNYVLQALQSKALYGGKPLVCKPYKAKLCMAAKLLAGGGKPLVCKPKAAKLRFASHTKLTKLCVQKLCFCKYKLCKALSKNKVYPKPKVIQNRRLSKTEGFGRKEAQDLFKFCINVFYL